MADPSSLANSNDLRITHLHLSLTANFVEKTLNGKVDLRFDVINDNLNEIVLDTSALTIQKIVAESGSELNWKLDDEKQPFGSALRIILLGDLVKGKKTLHLTIYYHTTPASSGIQWLPQEQTEGKQHPYLFTQFQAIHARSFVPCQDSPGVKQTYTADITVPEPLTALMSAIPTGSKSSAEHQGYTTFSFSQKVPISAYLLALVIGKLESRKIGPRSHVWSEKEKVEAGAHEFAETEQFIAAAEQILGIPYEWGQYDILLLPGSFPYGGMENPCLTFATPTLLAGDRSLATVIAHEISHSWTGNLVTNATWTDFWLNEGFTVFLERKIIGRVASQDQAEINAIIGKKALRKSLELFASRNEPEYAKLVPKLEGIDPDDAFSSVPYEKGFQFLTLLERTVGSTEKFEKFFGSWVATNKYKAATSAQFKNYFLDYFKKEGLSEDKLKSIDWDLWFYGSPEMLEFNSSLAKASYELADKWLKEGDDKDRTDLSKWSVNQVLVFLEQVELKGKLEHSVIQKLDNLYHFSNSNNSEIKFAWFQICLKAEYSEINPQVVKFLKEQGRMKFVRPLYRSLFATASGKDLALKTFDETRTYYHSIASKMIARDLNVA